MRIPWPKTMFGRLITVLLAALVPTQIIFVWAVLGPLGARPLPARTAEQVAVAAAPEAASRPHRRPWLPLVNVLLASGGIAAGAFLVSRNLTRPLGRLAEAAEALGGDVGTPAGKEEGPLKTRQVAQAFNVMRERLIRQVDSHSALLASMSHDTRTPLTGLRLRAEEIEGHVVLAIDGRCTLTGHGLSLKRAVSNLIDNALKFGGHAEVEARLGTTEARIWVRDRGPCIPADQLAHVFGPFYRVESSRGRNTGGSGLGLAIARDAIQAHRGMLRLRNREGGGLEAEVVLPVASDRRFAGRQEPE